MKANELRVGNIVKHWDHYCMIESIRKESGSYTITGTASNGYTGISNNIEAFEPIPLTPEILEKAGLKLNKAEDDSIDLITFCGSAKSVETENIVLIYMPYMLNFPVGDWKLKRKRELDKYKPPILYVHQLQNLYFALTGEELNIQL